MGDEVVLQKPIRPINVYVPESKVRVEMVYLEERLGVHQIVGYIAIGMGLFIFGMLCN